MKMKNDIELKQQYVLWMYKPLFLLVASVAVFLVAIVWACLFNPSWLLSAVNTPVLLRIQLTMLAFTLVILMLAVAFRRQYFEKPPLYLLLNNTYAYASLLWGCMLSIYGKRSVFFASAYGYVALIVAMVVLFKPLKAVIVYSISFFLYIVLMTIVWPNDTNIIADAFTAGLGSLFGIIICCAFYQFRAQIFSDQRTIKEQMQALNNANEQLQTLVHIDQLTGLYNRRFIEEVLTRHYETLQAEGRFLCCMMLDIDYFKKYNDYYGHPAGDICLYKVAQTVHQALRLSPSYTVRYGGEEFLILAAAKNGEQALNQAEQIRAAVAGSFIEHLAHPLKIVTVSIGIATLPPDRQLVGLPELVQRADEALYIAKEQNRNKVIALECNT